MIVGFCAHLIVETMKYNAVGLPDVIVMVQAILANCQSKMTHRQSLLLINRWQSTPISELEPSTFRAKHCRYYR